MKLFTPFSFENTFRVFGAGETLLKKKNRPFLSAFYGAGGATRKENLPVCKFLVKAERDFAPEGVKLPPQRETLSKKKKQTFAVCFL